MYIYHYIYLAMKHLETLRALRDYMPFFFFLLVVVLGEVQQITVELREWVHMGRWPGRKRSLDYGQMHNLVNIKKGFS